MKNLVIEAINETFEKMERIIPTQKGRNHFVSIQGVNPLQLVEFMGNRNYLYNNDKSAMYFILTNTAGEELIVNYDNDWNLLMEVVEKIESLTDINSNGCFMVLESIGFNAKFIFDDGTRILKDNKGETKIEAVYMAVVEFVKWYNENSADKN